MIEGMYNEFQTEYNLTYDTLRGTPMDQGGDHVNFRCGRRDPFDPNSVFLPPIGDGGVREPDFLKPRNGGMVCSYCGSMSGDELMAHLEAGDVSLTPTDKSYKVYVEGLARFAKFYFQHLDGLQKQRFVELMNLKRLKLEYPGHFYVQPFFVRQA